MRPRADRSREPPHRCRIDSMSPRRWRRHRTARRPCPDRTRCRAAPVGWRTPPAGRPAAGADRAGPGRSRGSAVSRWLTSTPHGLAASNGPAVGQGRPGATAILTQDRDHGAGVLGVLLTGLQRSTDRRGMDHRVARSGPDAAARSRCTARSPPGRARSPAATGRRLARRSADSNPGLRRRCRTSRPEECRSVRRPTCRGAPVSSTYSIIDDVAVRDVRQHDAGRAVHDPAGEIRCEQRLRVCRGSDGGR